MLAEKKQSQKGFFVVLEGIDGSGKATQTELLIQNLKKQKIKAKKIDFPRYKDNFFGAFIGECLAGCHGDFVKLDPQIASVLYACDRFESKHVIEKWKKEGCFVIADRYASANQIHQGGKIFNNEIRKNFLTWLEKLEYQVLKIPKPDLVIYLDVPVEISQKLIDQSKKELKKGYLKGKSDQLESDKKHLLKAKESAIKSLKEQKNWRKVECVKNNELLSKKTIAKMIWEVLKKEGMV